MSIQANHAITILEDHEGTVEKVETLPRHTAATLEAAKRAARDKGYTLVFDELTDHQDGDELVDKEGEDPEWVIHVMPE